MGNKIAMKVKIKILISFLIIFSFSLSSSTAVRSMTKSQIKSEVRNINSSIKGTKRKLKDIERRKLQYQANIKAKQAEAASLVNQLAILENRLAMTKVEVESIREEQIRVNLEIKKISIEVERKEEDIKKERRNIANTLKLMYKEGNVNAWEMLLLNDSLTDFLNEFKYLEDINKEMANSLDNLKRIKKDLERKKISMDGKKEELINLKKDLEDSLISMEEEEKDKAFMIEMTNNSEKEYQNLLAQAKKEQEQASLEIVRMEKAVREKMKSMSNKKLVLNKDGFIWPVPKNKITTYFHDPDYPFRYLFEHPAVDIRARQGTTLRAAASGYVARVKIRGSSYGYIMIVHGDGFSTVYGHASKSFVKADDYVVQGQRIGLSGGTPGTTGSGRFTTGPHLHFEVRLNGIPVDPLKYLP